MYKIILFEFYYRKIKYNFIKEEKVRLGGKCSFAIHTNISIYHH